MSLGIIDWGIGGISIVKLFKERRSNLPIVYFSDTGVTPYGKMKRAELVGRLNVVIEHLKSRGVTRLVIGCNAASTAIPRLSEQQIHIDGMIEIAVAEALRARPKRLGLIGGRRTVLSGSYRHAFKKKGITVAQRVAQPLSGLIEGGDTESPRLHAECERILRPLKRCSHILLACTHYAAIVDILKQHASSSTIFVDPAPALVSSFAGARLSARGPDIYLTTGDPEAMRVAADRAFGWKIDVATKVTV